MENVIRRPGIGIVDLTRNKMFPTILCVPEEGGIADYPAKLLYVPYINRYIICLTIHGNGRFFQQSCENVHTVQYVSCCCLQVIDPLK